VILTALNPYALNPYARNPYARNPYALSSSAGAPLRVVMTWSASP
jgi:hypothetical protein